MRSLGSLGMLVLCALVAGVIVCLYFWPWGPPPPSEGNGPAFVSVPEEVVALFLGLVASAVVGALGMLVLLIRDLVSPPPPEEAQ